MMPLLVPHALAVDVDMVVAGKEIGERRTLRLMSPSAG